MEEHWRPVVGYEGLYEVSNIGRVRSIDKVVVSENQYGRYEKTVKGRIMKTGKNKYGYLQVGLCKYGKVKTFLVHRLVAEAFIPNPNNLPEVNHKDERPWNNAVSNLEWCDRVYNNNYGTRNKRISQANKGKNGYWLGKHHSDETKRRIIETMSKKPVAAYTPDGSFVAEFPSIREAARVLNCFSTNIVGCLKGRYKSCSGYIWKYLS